MFILILTIFFTVLVPAVDASERGIGVRPSSIEVGEDVSFPYTQNVSVRNLSNRTEWIEVNASGVQIEPGRFSLDTGESRYVRVTFDGPAKGEVRISATRVSPEGLETGTGIVVPYSVGEEGATDHDYVMAAAVTGIWPDISIRYILLGLAILPILFFFSYLMAAVWRDENDTINT